MLERALIGVFHQVGKQHIHRYVDEAAFRWNQRKAIRDDDGDLIGFDRCPLRIS